MFVCFRDKMLPLYDHCQSFYTIQALFIWTLLSILHYYILLLFGNLNLLLYFFDHHIYVSLFFSSFNFNLFFSSSNFLSITKFHSHCSKRYDLIFSYNQVVFLCLYILHLYPVICHWQFEKFLIGIIVSSAAISIGVWSLQIWVFMFLGQIGWSRIAEVLLVIFWELSILFT